MKARLPSLSLEGCYTKIIGNSFGLKSLFFCNFSFEFYSY